MSWHYLQGQEAASWAGTSLDGAPSALLSLMPSPAASYSPGNATDAFRDSPSGMTSAHSTGIHGADTLTSFPEVSLARTSAQPERAQESTGNAPGCGVKWRESSARFDLASCGWKTHRSLFPEALPWSSATLPKWGMMQGGVLWERITPEPRTRGIGAGYLPTPTSSMMTMADMLQAKYAGNSGNRPSYQSAKTWPTPCATEARQGYQDRTRGKKGSQESLSTVIQGAPAREAGGSLNPNWVEWLMGWPLGWTSTEPMPESTWAAWQRAFRSEPTASGASETGRSPQP